MRKATWERTNYGWVRDEVHEWFENQLATCNVEEKPVGKVRFEVPEGTEFHDIVLVFRDKEYHFEGRNESGPWSLGVPRRSFATITASVQPNEEKVLRDRLEEKKEAVREQREKYGAQRRALESAQRERNRAQAALDTYLRSRSSERAPLRNPFA